MKIIHIGNINRRANGVGQVINRLSFAQKELGHEVLTLTAIHKEEALDNFTEVHNID